MRVVFASKVKTMAEHLARHRLADLFLDTLPYNAHTTCSDALWAGLPVVTCVGDTFPSRVAGSLLSTLSLPELITYNLEAYYQLALSLAEDRQKLAALRNKLVTNRDRSPLFDSARYTRDLEQLFQRLFNECTDPINQVF
jgi:predicted O-linked N-acetylglucosamine transferase (SPINDLY family)